MKRSDEDDRSNTDGGLGEPPANARLRALAEREEDPGPPGELEGRLREAFRAAVAAKPAAPHPAPLPRSGREADRGGRRVLFVTAAAAAVVLIAGGVSYWWGFRPPSPSSSPVAAPVAAGPASPAARRRPGAFVPLGSAERARGIEVGRIARVRMRAEVAAYFGWPLLPDVPDGRVSADVLVGEDGTARALRFLPATFTSVRPGPEEERTP
jgi:hypothetical protein